MGEPRRVCHPATRSTAITTEDGQLNDLERRRRRIASASLGPRLVGRIKRSGHGQPKLGTLIRERLLADIRSGRWRAGDRVPTEIELMAAFGVSRTPIREAMQSLQMLGIVDISPRRGATVRALPMESVVDLALLAGTMSPDHSVADLFEFRVAMEVAIAGLAASHASDGQLADLRAILGETSAAVESQDRPAAQLIDVRFHAALADASANVVFQAVARALNGLLVEQRRVTGGIPGASGASLEEHRLIAGAIERHDPAAARAAAESHIRATRMRYESSLVDPIVR
jgi:GntR family transcriptional repressor for pyruvate dehydrogenase complex